MKAYFYANDADAANATDWHIAFYLGVPWVNFQGEETSLASIGNGWSGYEAVTIDAAERAVIEAAPSFVKRVITNDAGVVLSSNLGLTGTVLVAAIRAAVLAL